MKSFFALILSALMIAATSALGVVNSGDEAPAFTLKTPAGESVSLSDFSGKYVVLEWVNPGCPFVKKFYNAGAMQAFQKQAQDTGVVWLSINSTSIDHGDYLDAAASSAYYNEKGVHSIWLMDASGEVGKAYGATRTPEMFLIDPSGKIIYQGAIDDHNSANPDTLDGAQNYVMAALTAALAGQPIVKAQTRPYGCGVKY